MTVTNDERREVAARLRYVAEHGAPEWETSADCIAICLKEPDSPLWSGTEKLFALLADLIEPEPERTCRFNVVIENIPGKKKRANICECSNCGYRCAYGFIIDEYFQYCPNCGTKILND